MIMHKKIYISVIPLDTRRCCDVDSTSLTLIQHRNNVVCSVVYICSSFQTIERGECRWLCGGDGEFIECSNDEVVVSSCGSGRQADCEDNFYCPGLSDIFTAIECCQVSAITV